MTLSTSIVEEDNFRLLPFTGSSWSEGHAADHIRQIRLASDVKQWSRTCQCCQAMKINRHTRAPSSNFAAPDGRFTHIHADLVGPRDRINGHEYILTIIDRFTRWPVAVPLTTITAEAVANAIFQNWISIFGCPAVITTDRGPQFQSTIYQICQFTGYKAYFYYGIPSLQQWTSRTFPPTAQVRMNSVYQRSYVGRQATIRNACATQYN